MKHPPTHTNAPDNSCAKVYIWAVKKFLFSSINFCIHRGCVGNHTRLKGRQIIGRLNVYTRSYVVYRSYAYISPSLEFCRLFALLSWLTIKTLYTDGLHFDLEWLRIFTLTLNACTDIRLSVTCVWFYNFSQDSKTNFLRT